ncbi:DUF3078 domain-containing protein, partial [Candidatus Dependentiae bacterium]|nr:DUF3078 domain-containing protein [Candidatus Dependentiae bacterium]
NKKQLKSLSTDTIEGWKKGGTITLNLSQASLSNWAAGGQNSISANGLVSLFANYKKNDHIWENYLEVGYGTIKNGKNQGWIKTDDKINATSKYGRKAFKNWYYAGLLDFKTQMISGYNYPNDSVQISNLLAPGYLTIAIGLNYSKQENFTAFLAPLSAKTTFVNNQRLADAGSFGVTSAIYDEQGNMLTAGKKTRLEVGGYIRLFLKHEIAKNVTFQTKIDLFSNYIDNPQNIDINWETLITMKVNKLISATLSTQLIYDDNVIIELDKNQDGVIESSGPRVQFKEILGIGISYSF